MFNVRSSVQFHLSPTTSQNQPQNTSNENPISDTPGYKEIGRGTHYGGKQKHKTGHIIHCLTSFCFARGDTPQWPNESCRGNVLQLPRTSRFSSLKPHRFHPISAVPPRFCSNFSLHSASIFSQALAAAPRFVVAQLSSAQANREPG